MTIVIILVILTLHLEIIIVIILVIMILHLLILIVIILIILILDIKSKTDELFAKERTKSSFFLLIILRSVGCLPLFFLPIKILCIKVF